MAHHTTQEVSHDQAHDEMNVTNPEHGEHHIVSPLQYTYVFLTLIAFTAITWGVAYIDLGWLNPVVALAIACFKAVVVILFFMHVKYQSRLIKMTVACGFFTFLILITMTMADYISRGWGMW
jgi:cytochrome c oxidase subunit 4